MFEKEIVAALKKKVKEVSLEVPPDSALGDFAFPCFTLAKEMKKSPAQIAEELAKTVELPDIVSKVTATGPYVNFFLDPAKVAKVLFSDILKKKDKFGSSDLGKGKTVCVEFSSPNIGKPMHFGHLRSTVVGQSLSLLHEFMGFKVIRLNYLGDWGTQFGKLIYAYLNWGSSEHLHACPIKHLYDLYVKFNEHVEKDEKYQAFAREWFNKLENKDQQATSLWAKFKHYSVDEFRKIYELLGVTFDCYNGEAYYSRKVDSALALIEKKKLSEVDEGALVVRIPGYEMPLMLKKSDESTTYASRDVAALIDRIDEFNFDSILYVVGHEQSLHFEQLFKLMKMLGFEKTYVHIAFGLYLSPEGGKMATRKGKAVFMEDVLEETIALAKKTIEEKNPDLKNKDEVARSVAVGAIFFGDLLNDRVKDVVFDLKRILSFEGDTGPYLMYTHARAASILKKAKFKSKSFDASLLQEPSEIKVIKLLSKFSSRVEDSLKQYKPHILAQYLIEFGRAFNEFYHKCSCMGEKDKSVQVARLTLVEASRQVIENGLRLLGISAPGEL
ncbi:arginine--tRNA ligase [Candidatus Woesearchaeota archaeon]|nr:arginine--tRNA ligase [Candidatus Woesearchaeota archaeon]